MGALIDFLLLPETLPFSLALAFLFGFGLLEIATYYLGFGLLGFLDDLLPNFEAEAPDLSVSGKANAAVEGPSLLTKGLGWLGLAHVPLLVFLLMTLFLFGATGLLVQFTAASALERFLPTGLVAIGALFVTVPLVRRTAKTLGRLIPRDQTQAVSEATFQGRPATIVMGTARRGHPTQARLRDEHGQPHYVLVEPLDESRTLAQGEQVVLVQRVGARFLAIPFEEGLLPEPSPPVAAPVAVREK